MKERGILFGGWSIPKLLDDSKTQTRRVMKPQPPEDTVSFSRIHLGGVDRWRRYKCDDEYGSVTTEEDRRCPYGVPGDRLYCKETWRIGAWNENEGTIAVDYRADGYAREEWLTVPDEEAFTRYWIESSDDAAAAGIQPDPDGGYHWKAGESPCRWRPSIFMPRWASRIDLEITDIRVERVQDISPYDALREGIVLPVSAGCDVHPPPPEWEEWDEKRRDEWCEMQGRATYFARCADADDHVTAFHELWDSLHAKRGYGWDANPWVWSITFKRIKP